MATVQCTTCNAAITMEAEPGSVVRCPACGKRMALGVQPEPALRGAVQAVGEAPQPVAVQHPGEEEARPLSVRALPWLVSVFFHVGLMLIMAFCTMLVVMKDMPPAVHIPGACEDNPQFVPLKFEQKKIDLADPPRSLQPDLTRKNEAQIPNLAALLMPQVKIDSRIGTGRVPGARETGMPRSTGGLRGPFAPGPIRDPAGGTARNLVFVIDRSGSMIGTFDTLRLELLNTVGRLSQKHSFHVVFFSDGRLAGSPAGGLVSGRDENKIEVARFLEEIRPSGRTDPLPALNRAFDLLSRSDPRRPGKQIFLLTDGVFPDNKAVLELVRKRNAGKEVMINTYLYGHRPAEAVELMRKLAADNGGRYQYVDPEEIGHN